MTTLTNAIINKIGTDYYDRHPIEEKSSDAGTFSKITTTVATFFKKILHDNHALADQLRAYNNEDSSEQQKWLFLLNIYAQLPNDRGEIAKKIEQLVLNTFDVTIQKTKMNGFGGIQLLSTADIAANLQAAVKNHFLLPIHKRAISGPSLLSPSPK